MDWRRHTFRSVLKEIENPRCRARLDAGFLIEATMSRTFESQDRRAACSTKIGCVQIRSLSRGVFFGIALLLRFAVFLIAVFRELGFVDAFDFIPRIGKWTLSDELFCFRRFTGF